MDEEVSKLSPLHIKNHERSQNITTNPTKFEDTNFPQQIANHEDLRVPPDANTITLSYNSKHRRYKMATKIPYLQKIEMDFKILWDNAEQQTIPRSKRFHSLFLPITSSIIFAVLGLLFLSLGLLIHFNSKRIQEINIQYDMEDTELSFTVPELMQPPIYIYYDISNFFGNSRLYVRDAPNSIYSESSCTFVTNYKQAFDVRTDGGILNLPDLRTNVLNQMTIFPDENTVYPCGLASLSIFNDKVQILDKFNEEIKISRTQLDNDWDLIQYMDTYSTIGNNQAWKILHNLEYRIWLHPPPTADFRKPYGTLNIPLEAGEYKLRIIDNLWPSKAWGCTKSFTLTKVTWLGGKNTALSIILLVCGSLYFVFAIMMLIIHALKYLYLTQTYHITNIPCLKYDLLFK